MDNHDLFGNCVIETYNLIRSHNKKIHTCTALLYVSNEFRSFCYIGWQELANFGDWSLQSSCITTTCVLCIENGKLCGQSLFVCNYVFGIQYFSDNHNRIHIFAAWLHVCYDLACFCFIGKFNCGQFRDWSLNCSCITTTVFCCIERTNDVEILFSFATVCLKYTISSRIITQCIYSNHACILTVIFTCSVVFVK